MNCREFERTIIDGNHLMEASTEARLLAHAETCAQCSARLNREQRMTAALRAVAANDAAINAPERIKLALRRVFDEQAAAALPPVLMRSARRKLLWGMTAAAMLLLSTIITALWLRTSDEKVDNTPSVLADPQKPPVAVAREQGSVGTHSATVARTSGKTIRRHKLPVKNEDAAGLLPLTFVARPGPTEFIQTVRVEISRAKLLSMGLPVNVDRGEGMVKAEIIIGEDGVARAVRILN